ncbi:hypothetical protein EHQ52_02485 [Leptospira koniambonensis]|uniref:Uncharacterized protein n=1 Tax=Leptospira koniambonensis TaxID=2484950 RepID=A0A4R9JDV0_9LEPT|nr:hypothetical protein EHQ52_02485 [Leptospira koniambonensis]
MGLILLLALVLLFRIRRLGP